MFKFYIDENLVGANKPLYSEELTKKTFETYIGVYSGYGHYIKGSADDIQRRLGNGVV